MATIHLLEAKNASIGGLLLQFPPSNYAMQLAWPESAKNSTPAEMGKELATKALQHLIDTGRTEEANGTNWASLTAGCGQQFRIWRDRLAARASAKVIGEA